MKSLLTFLFICISTLAFAQNQTYLINGVLKDSTDSAPLISATIILINEADSSRKYTTSDFEGNFTFKNLENGKYSLLFRYVGYKTFQIVQEVNGKNINLGTIILNPKEEMLEVVEIEGKIPPVVQQGDTTQFNAAAFKTNPDASTEDLIKKMPGITVEQGTVKAQGEDVQQVLVDGKPFFGDDPSLALKNLPAEIVDRIEVFDQQSEQAQFTGFDDGESKKTINIVTREDMRNGTFGNFYAGYGDEDKYKAGGNINFFRDDQRISIVGLSNNINDQNFSSQDLLGIASSGGGRRGGRRGGGGRPGGDVGSFLVGQSGGINTTSSFGINYSDEWGEKFKISGSYFFNYSENTNDQLQDRETFISEDSSQYYTENSESNSENYNHRLNLKLEYDIDDNNSIVYSPSFSYQDNQSLSYTDAATTQEGGALLNTSINNYFADNSGYNFSNNLLFRHRFSKRGRTVSMRFRTDINDKDTYYSLFAENEYFNTITTLDTTDQQSFSNTSGNTYSGNIRYTEPIGRRGQLMVNLERSITKNNSDKKVYDLNPETSTYNQLDSLLSNTFDNTYNTTSAGTSYRLRIRKGFFNVGLEYQYAELNSDQVFPVVEGADISKSFKNVLPNMMLMYRFSKSSNLRVFYRTNTNAPSVSQLQDVINNTNQLSLSTGNPNLKQEFSHSLVGRYSKVNPDKGSNFFAFINLSQTDNYISNATIVATQDTLISDDVVLQKGSQLSVPVNLSGYWNARSFISFGKPIEALKSNLNFNTGVTYSRTPGLVNYKESLSNTYNISQGVVVSSNISEKVDFTVSYTANYNVVKNKLQPDLEGNYFYQLTNGKANFIFGKNFVFSADINHYLYTGLSDGFNQSFTLVNLGFGKKFMQNDRAELKLTVYDLLKENSSISRTITESYIEDTITEVLQRYFMLTFTYRIKEFKRM
ncbi:TonB-dependent receptor [Chondrinema litorale]|uniref:TonB-dependent receptor n=1 Tax=Chondrinema litorale TaxID=2994555 RepID=UPI0025437ADC|nr:TonB-dependent receptor [Chondrinema litorale]UZR99312.1 TonB-dependent receptor [Chondrinema litorale]